MTLHEYINSYTNCAINDVPAEAIEYILQSVSVSGNRQRLHDTLRKMSSGDMYPQVSLRFRHGKLEGHTTIGNYDKRFSLVKLEAIVPYAELFAEEGFEDDFTAVMELC